MKVPKIYAFILLVVVIVGCDYRRELTSKESKTVDNHPKSDDYRVAVTDETDAANAKIWTLKKTDGSLLIFEDGTKLETGLSDLEYIGQLKNQKKAPYFILSGRDCDNCDENISIFVWSPDMGPMKKGQQQARYSYPGRESDYLTGELVFESKMYYGACLGYEACIFLQRTLTDEKLWEESIFIVRVDKDGTLKEMKITSSEDIKNLSAKITKCTELPGVSNSTEP